MSSLLAALHESFWGHLSVHHLQHVAVYVINTTTTHWSAARVVLRHHHCGAGVPASFDLAASLDFTASLDFASK